MNRFFFFLLFCGSSLFATAQETDWQLQLYVVDALQGRPLQGVHLSVGQQLATTDDKGYASLQLDKTHLPYLLVCTFVGYDTLRLKLNSPPPQPLRLELRATSLQLEEVVVNALRQHEKAPLSHTIVSQKEIEDIYIGEDAPFLLQYKTPSLLVQSQSGTPFGNYADLRLRGMDESRINLTLAGIPLNDMLDHGFYFSNFSDLAESTSSIQVQRGVGSSTHGAAAYAGSINLGLPRVFGPARIGFQSAGGAFGSLKLSAEGYTGALPSGLGTYLRVSRSRSDGYRDHSGHEAYSLFLHSAYKKKQHLIELIALTGESRNEMAYTQVPESKLRQVPRYNPISESETDRFSQSLVALRHTFFATTEQAAGYTFYFGHAEGDFPFGFEGEQGYTQINYYLRNIHLGLQAHLQGRLGAGNWSLGSQGYVFLRKNQESNIPERAVLTYEDRSRKVAANVFAKIRHPFGRLQLFADLQLRYAAVSLLPELRFLEEAADIPTREWLFFNPKAGLRYQLNESLSTYSSLSLSHREPTRIDILGEVNINSSTISAAQDTNYPRHEQVLDWEVGLSSEYKQLQGGLNFFYMSFRNEIAPIGQYIEQHYAQLRKNLPQSYRLGLEGNLLLPLSSHLYLSSLGYWMQARVEQYAPENDPTGAVFTDVPTGGAPNFQLQLQANYQLPIWKEAFSLWLRSRYQGKTYLNPISEVRMQAPANFLMDMGLSLEWGHRLQLGLQLRNLLDRRYYGGGEVSQGATGTEARYFGQAGRHLFASLRIELH